MGIARDILADEQQRLHELRRRYREQIRELPRGSISRKRRGNREYCYLAYREGRKVRFDYIGPVESDAVADLEKQIARRREIEARLKQVEQNLDEIERGLRATR